MKLELIVQSIAEETVLLTDSQQALVWPKNRLPVNLQEGQTIYFAINDTPIIVDLTPTEILNNILKI